MSAFPAVPSCSDSQGAGIAHADAEGGVSGEGARARHGVLHRLDTDSRSGRIVLYVQSLAEPDWSRLASDYLLTQLGLENPACKLVRDQYRSIRPGTVLRFRLRANPTKKINTQSGPNGEKQNGRRIGLFREEDLVGWLERKAEDGGFTLLDVAVNGAGPDGRVQGLHPVGKMIFRSVTFEGRLVVSDADRFQKTLAAGLGSAKAYGFGLLSVAPAAG